MKGVREMERVKERIRIIQRRVNSERHIARGVRVCVVWCGLVGCLVHPGDLNSEDLASLLQDESQAVGPGQLGVVSCHTHTSAFKLDF